MPCAAVSVRTFDLAHNARKASLAHTDHDICDQRRRMPVGIDAAWISALGPTLLASRQWPVAARKLPSDCLGFARSGPFYNQLGRQQPCTV